MSSFQRQIARGGPVTITYRTALGPNAVEHEQKILVAVRSWT